jgi:hypothetical protein
MAMAVMDRGGPRRGRRVSRKTGYQQPEARYQQ